MSGKIDQVKGRIKEAAGVLTDDESLKREGLSILLVEQNLPLALRLADHVHVLSRGRIVHSSTPGELWTNDEVKARYLGV